nr:hypothetical protein [Tanacetum cinerariifolium]
MDDTLKDMMSNQFKNAEEYAYHLEQAKNYMDSQVVWETREEDIMVPKKDTPIFYGPQRNPNEPLMYFYNKDLFYLKYRNTKEKKTTRRKKRIMSLTEIPKFCDAMLDKVMKKVKLKIVESQYKSKTLVLGDLDLKIMEAFEREIEKRLKHRRQMRRCGLLVNERRILQCRVRQE